VLWFFALGNVDPRFCTLDLRHSCGELIFGLGGLQQVLGVAQGLLGARDLNLVGTFDCLSQHSHFVGEDFGKSPGHGEAVQLAVRSIADLP